MIPAWPDELPRHFERQDYGAELGEGRLRSRPTLGPSKVRRRSRAMPEAITGKMRMRRPQLDRFLAFYRDEIGGGTLPFLFPDPMGGLPILVQWGEAAPKWAAVAGIWWELALALDKLWTGDFEPGLPALPAGYAFVTAAGAYVVQDGRPVIARVP